MFVSNVFLFASIIVILALMPGPDVIYITTRGIAQGRSAALLSTLGVCAGYLLYTVLTAFGLSTALQSSVLVFEIVRAAGAIYLLYLGICSFLNKAGVRLNRGTIKTISPKRMVQEGMLTSILNPKGILVFAALLPQFTDPHLGALPFQMIALGLTFTLICLVIYGGYAYLSGSLGEKVITRPRFVSIINMLMGSVLIGLGVRLFFLERH